jgi:hypothetical protein
MKKRKIIYTGDVIESMWGCLGYIGPIFLISYFVDKKSLFIKLNAIRSALTIFTLLIVNLPLIIVKLNIISFSSNFLNILFLLYYIFALIISALTFIDYCIMSIDTANGKYIKTILIDRLYSKILNNYISKNIDILK